MRFYIATGITNGARAAALAEVLTGRGHELTYNWMERGDIRHEGAHAMSECAFNELRAVRDAELVVVLLPGGAGTHTELGVAIATRSNKRIMVWSEYGSEFIEYDRACTFYFHPSVERLVCPFDELLRRMDSEHIGSEV